jgi:hypothetical protein
LNASLDLSQNFATDPQISLELSRKPRPVYFKPYTLADYNILKSKPIRLGGIGPARIGTDEWIAKKKQFNRMNRYALDVREYNEQLANRHSSI